MVSTKVDSILQDLFIDLWRDAVSVRGSSDPPFLPKVEIALCLPLFLFGQFSEARFAQGWVSLPLSYSRFHSGSLRGTESTLSEISA